MAGAVPSRRTTRWYWPAARPAGSAAWTRWLSRSVAGTCSTGCLTPYRTRTGWWWSGHRGRVRWPAGDVRAVGRRPRRRPAVPDRERRRRAAFRGRTGRRRRPAPPLKTYLVGLAAGLAAARAGSSTADWDRATRAAASRISAPAAAWGPAPAD